MLRCIVESIWWMSCNVHLDIACATEIVSLSCCLLKIRKATCFAVKSLKQHFPHNFKLFFQLIRMHYYRDLSTPKITRFEISCYFSTHHNKTIRFFPSNIAQFGSFEIQYLVYAIFTLPNAFVRHASAVSSFPINCDVCWFLKNWKMAKYEFNGKNSNSFELKKEKTARWIYFFLKQTFTHKIMVLFPHSQLNQFTPFAFHHYMHVLHWAWQLFWKVWSAVNSVNFPEKCELILWQRTKQPQFIFYERKLYLSLWMCLINCGTQSNFRVFFLKIENVQRLKCER